MSDATMPATVAGVPAVTLCPDSAWSHEPSRVIARALARLRQLGSQDAAEAAHCSVSEHASPCGDDDRDAHR